MKSGIPVSGKEPIESPEINGVVYLCWPAIGKIEKKIQSIQSSIYDVRSFFQDAAKKVDESNVGREWKPGERIDEIQVVAKEMSEYKFFLEYSPENNNRRRDEMFDTICTGWRGDGVYQLGKDENPSDHVPGAIKQRVIDWYMETQMQLSGEEIKN